MDYEVLYRTAMRCSAEHVPFLQLLIHRLNTPPYPPIWVENLVERVYFLTEGFNEPSPLSAKERARRIFSWAKQ